MLTISSARCSKFESCVVLAEDRVQFLEQEQEAESQTGNFTCTKGHSLVREVSAIRTAVVQSPNECLSAARAQLV